MFTVNQLVKQFDEIRKMMKMLMKGGGKLPLDLGGDTPGGMQLPGRST